MFWILQQTKKERPMMLKLTCLLLSGISTIVIGIWQKTPYFQKKYTKGGNQKS
jgi:hypothetical protein